MTLEDKKEEDLQESGVLVLVLFSQYRGGLMQTVVYKHWFAVGVIAVTVSVIAVVFSTDGV